MAGMDGMKPINGFFDDREFLFDDVDEQVSAPKATEAPVTVPIGKKDGDEKPQQGPKIDLNSMLSAAIGNAYCNNDEMQNNLLDGIEGNDTWEIPLGDDLKNLGITGLSVELSQGEDNKVKASYEIKYNTIQSTSEQVNQAGQAAQSGMVFKDKAQEERYAELSKKIVDPLASDKEKREAENELKGIVRSILEPLTDDKGYAMFSKKQLRQVTNGIVEDIKAEDRFKNTTVFYKQIDYDKARKELEAEQKAIRERAKNGEELSDEDIATLKKRYDYLPDEVRSFVASHGKDLANDDPNNLFFTDKKFDSDKFKAFAHKLTGDDANLTVAERSAKANMFEMYAGEEARAAQQRINEAKEKGETPNQADVDLVRKTQRPGWFNGSYIEGPTRKFHAERQAALVRTAGLRADNDYRPLLAMAEAALSVAAGYLAGCLLTTSTYTSTNAFIQADGVVYAADPITGEISVNLTGATSILAHADAKAIADVTGKNLFAAANFGAGVLADEALHSALVPPAAQGAVIQQGNKVVEAVDEGEIVFECPTPCPEVKEEDKKEDDKKPTPCPDGDCCEEIINITIPRAQKAGIVSIGDGETGIQKYIGLLDKDILDCFRVDEDQSLPAGSRIPRSEFKAFITEFRLKKLGSKRAYLKSGEQEICAEFTFNGVKYKFDKDLFDKLLKDLEAHPDNYQYNGGGTNLKAGKVKDIPCP